MHSKFNSSDFLRVSEMEILDAHHQLLLLLWLPPPIQEYVKFKVCCFHSDALDGTTQTI